MNICVRALSLDASRNHLGFTRTRRGHVLGKMNLSSARYRLALDRPLENKWQQSRRSLIE